MCPSDGIKSLEHGLLTTNLHSDKSVYPPLKLCKLSRRLVNSIQNMYIGLFFFFLGLLLGSSQALVIVARINYFIGSI